MGDVAAAPELTRMERGIIGLLMDPEPDAFGYCFAPWPPEHVERVLSLLRRARALRRRSPRTKAGRRARRRAFYSSTEVRP